MKMLRRLPKLLRFIPGTAQDVRAYFLTLQYWLAGSEKNLANMVRMLVGRYAEDNARVCAARSRRAGRISGCRAVSSARDRGAIFERDRATADRRRATAGSAC